MFLEDLNSTNGTYLGSSPLEIHRIVGKESVSFGDYLRFGHSSQYYRVQTCMAPGIGTLSVPLDRSDIPANFNENDNYYERQQESNLQQEDGLGYLTEMSRKRLGINSSEKSKKLSFQDSELLSYPANQNQDDSQSRVQSQLSKSTPILPQGKFRDDRVTNVRHEQKYGEQSVTDTSSKLSNRMPDEKIEKQIVLRDKNTEDVQEVVDFKNKSKDAQTIKKIVENREILYEDREECDLIGNREEYSISDPSDFQQRKLAPEKESMRISINYPVMRSSKDHCPISVMINPPKENNDLHYWEHFSSKNKSFDKNYDMMRKSHSEGNIAMNIHDNENSDENDFHSDFDFNFDFNHDEGFEERKDPRGNINLIGERNIKERKTFDCQKVDQIIDANKNNKNNLDREKNNNSDRIDNKYNKNTILNKDENKSEHVDNLQFFKKSEDFDDKETDPVFSTSFTGREDSINWQGQVCYENSIH